MQTVVINEPPTSGGNSTPVSIISSSTTIYLGYGVQSVTLSVKDYTKLSGYTYSWTPSKGISNSTSPKIVVNPTVTTTYTVTLTDVNKCVRKGTVTIKVVDVRCQSGCNSTETKVILCQPSSGGCSGGANVCVIEKDVEKLLSKGYSLGSCAINYRMTTGNGIEMFQVPLYEKLQIKIMPNPSPTDFTLVITSDNLKDHVALRVIDIYGKMLESRKSILPGSTIMIGGSYRPGIYFVELIQGGQKSKVKLVKQ
jgi:hypothetical protein